MTCDLSVHLLVSKVPWGELLNSAIVKQHRSDVYGGTKGIEVIQRSKVSLREGTSVPRWKSG